MDCFFRCQKSTFNLENNKRICQGNFFVYHNQDLLTPDVFFEPCIYQGYIQNFERNRTNSICIGVKNFAESVNLSIQGSFHKEKKMKLSKREYYYICGKVNFSLIHPTHITIDSF